MDRIEALRTLGLTGSEAFDDIHRAFRKLAMKYHPDRFQTFAQKAWATRRFIQIKNAYDFLSSEKSANNGFVVETGVPTRNPHQDGVYGEEADSQPTTNNLDFDWLPFPFGWVFSRLPDENTILGFVAGLLLIPAFIIGFPYFIFRGILMDVVERFGIVADSGSNLKIEQVFSLLISTVAALIYFPIYWFFYGYVEGSVFVQIFVRFAFVFVGFFVFSEWVSFFLFILWSRSINGYLKSNLPAVVDRR